MIDVDLEELVTALESGLFNSVELTTVCNFAYVERCLLLIVKAYIARINEVNGTLHMVTELNPDALAIAAQLDAERKNGTIRG